MIAELPIIPTPDWLRRVARAADGGLAAPFEPTVVLQGSVYYPASGLDGNPLARLGGNVPSFVYVDYGVRQTPCAARSNASRDTGCSRNGH